MRDEQVRANGLIQDVDAAGARPGDDARRRVPRRRRRRSGDTRPAPLLGADTDAVLAELGA